MRRSIMKRGKGAGVSEIVEYLRESADMMRLDYGDPPLGAGCREAADTIEALQQRCEELEGLGDRLLVYIEMNNDKEERIAALEGALEAAQAAMWDAHYGKGIAVEYAQSVDRKVRQALSAREEPGGCNCLHMFKNPRCPIHGTGRQNEGE